MSRKTLAGVLVAILLLGASVLLALDRIYQVDELQNVFMARILGRGLASEYETNAGIFLFGPMSMLARHAQRSASLLVSCRLLFLGLFWINIFLLAHLAGTRIRSRGGGLLLLGAATLAPLWDYGMEIRHDNVLLFELLVLWALGRTWVSRLGARRAYVAIGLMAALMQLTAFKGFLYAVPACSILLMCPHPTVVLSRRRLLVLLMSGSLLGSALGTAFHLAQGTWRTFIAVIAGSVGVSVELSQAPAGPSPSHVAALSRIVTQTPLLACALLVFTWLAARELVSKGRGWFRGATYGPEALLLLAGLGAFLVNPTPFPYILVLLVPQAFLAAARLEPALSERLGRRGDGTAPVIALLVAAQVIPFLLHTVRHLGFPSTRQVLLADVAESLTDPVADRVWDGVGLVSTRESIGFNWFLHSLNIDRFRDGTRPPIRTMLASKPAAVVIRNYRTDWLPAEDQDFLRRQYVALSDELLVLGGTVPAGGGAWTCLHGGRYVVMGVSGETPREVSVDGLPIGGRPVEMKAGPHTISSPSACVVAWVGPRLDRLPFIGRGDHRRLFAGWY